MAHADFVHLRVHSAYSLSEGAIRIKDLVALCRDRRMPAVAVTDTGNLFGALEFSLAASAAGIQPIIGTILCLARPEEAGGRPGLRPTLDALVLLAQTEAGYANLMALDSKAFLETGGGEPPHLAWTDLEGRTEGLIALSGGPTGIVNRLLAESRPREAEEALLRLAALFPGRFYVELMRHGVEAEERVEPALVDLAYRHDLPLVATNNVFFADEAMYEAHDALLCIADGTYVAEANRRRVTPNHRFRSAEEMRALFADLPEAVENTVVIARRCSVMVRTRKPILPAFPTGDGRNEAEELRAQAVAGLERRLDAIAWPPAMDEAAREARRAEYRDRLAYELSVIVQMEFPGYFLIVADFIQWAKAEGIPVGPGRGSGAGSVVAWALTITDLDPLQFGLLFERFLNPERVSMPDFDIDFCQDRRDEVIDYVRRKYGDGRVAQIITFGKLQARAVLRDVGRVLQMPYGQVDRICKLVPNNPANPVTLRQAIDGEPQLQAMRDGDADIAHLIDIAMRLEGLYRHASTHAAGVVIGDRPLAELVPLYRDPRSALPVTQFNMKYVEQAGLVKFDFLGLKTLTVLDRAVELLHARGIEIDLLRLPLDDRPSYEMLARGETTAVFQFESSGMRDVLRKVKPDRFEELPALVSLYRPGPMDNIPKYIKVKEGLERPDYLHPSLEPILRETFGIMIYQEQVMEVAQVLAGYTLGGADLLRRAMGKKIRAEMEAQKKTFVDGAASRGVPSAQASMIFDQVEKFAGYGFNKSHAVAYALVAYQTAYLKANHPVDFFAAVLTYDMSNTDKLALHRQELDRLGIRLLPPDINRSDAEFTVEAVEGGRLAIRYALGALKGVGLEATRELVKERRQNGRFADVFSFVRRLDTRLLNKRQLESLIRAGAFDALDDDRARLLAGADTLIRYGQAEATERASGQASLFGGPGGAAPVPTLPAVQAWDMLERLREEYEAVGFYLSAHPLHSYDLSRLGIATYAELPQRARASTSGRVRLAGIVVGRREIRTKSDKRMAFVALSDPTAQFEVLFFAEILGTARPLLESGTAVAVTVEAQRVDEGFRLTCIGIEKLEEASGRSSAAIRLFLSDARAVPTVRAMLDGLGGGRASITVVVPVDASREAEIQLPDGYAVTPSARTALRRIAGVADLRDA